MSGHLHRYRAPRKRLHVVPRQFAGPIEDPFAGAFHLGRHGKRRWSAAVLGSLLLEGCLVGLAYLDHDRHPPTPVRREVPVVVAQVKPPPPPPPPAAPLQPEHPQPKPPTRQARRAAPPPPAQAGKVVAATPDPAQPLDMTDFAMVAGQGKFVGGYTASNGTGTRPVTAPPAAHSEPSAKPSPPAASGPSLAKPPGPARKDWSCAWPDEEQDSDLHDARVSLRVALDADGTPERVEVLSAPTPSFGEAARRCALSETYRPALDDAGKRVAATTSPFLVHFLR